MTKLPRTRYSLEDTGSGTIWNIVKGRATVGRVVKCGPEAPGAFFSRIGREEAYGVTPVAAFEKVAAKAMEVESKEALSRSSVAVRASAAEERAANEVLCREVEAALQAEDFEAFFELTTIPTKRLLDATAKSPRLVKKGTP